MTVFADPSLPHQIVLRFRVAAEGSMGIAVTCNCMVNNALACRVSWDDPREPMRIWRDHMAKVNYRASKPVNNSQISPVIRQLSARVPTATCAVVTACQWLPKLAAHRTAG